MLQVHALEELPDFAAFEALLAEPGPWVAGFDFPFGMPRRLIENLGWPMQWEGYVAEVGRLGRAGFADVLAAYRAPRPSGDKQHLRRIDRLADSCSPMMMAGVPVGRMFAEGAPRLLASGATVEPFLRRDAARIAVEAYPALVARRFTGGASYKADERARQTPARARARAAIREGILGEGLAAAYGFRVGITAGLRRRLGSDPGADRLDSILCAVQAAWAWTKREAGFGIPANVDGLEGWIVDPAMASAAAE